MAVFGLLFVFHHFRYMAIMHAYIYWPQEMPFGDWRAMPAASACSEGDYFVYRPNPCQLFNYSPLWLLFLPIVPSGPIANVVVGATIGICFLASLSLLATPKNKTEQGIRLAATLSSGVALGVERGNVDLIVFLLLAVAVFVVGRFRSIGLVGYGLIILAGLLKFYPLSVLILVLRERIVPVIWVGLASFAAMALLVVIYQDELKIVLAYLPQGQEFAMQFSAADLPKRLASHLANIAATGNSPSSAAWMAAALRPVMMILMLVVSVMLYSSSKSQGLELPTNYTLIAPMIVGASATLFCFLAGQNYLYRGIFLLPVLPGLMQMRDAPRSLWRFGRLSTCILIVLLLWMPSIKWGIMTLGVSDDSRLLRVVDLAYQFSWWWIASALSALLIAFVVASPIGPRWLRAQQAARRSHFSGDFS